MKINFIYFFLFLNYSVLFSQQHVLIDAKIESNTSQLSINQTIKFTNFSKKEQNFIILNDWNYAYSNKKSALSKRLSDEYVRNFHLSNEKTRGNTTINTISVNSETANWHRLEDNTDIIKIEFKNTLKQGESITVELNYNLKIPDAKFTKIGHNQSNCFLKDAFLMLSKLDKEGNFLIHSNENLDDSCNEIIDEIYVSFSIPENYNITSNLTQSQKNNSSFTFNGNNINEIIFDIELKNSYENFVLNDFSVETNLKDYKIPVSKKSEIIEKVHEFIASNIGKSAHPKITITQTEYDRNPFYGLNQLPSFLSPFPNEFLFEITFLKAYTQTFLKQNLNIDFREDHFVFDGIQIFIINEYIEKNYPDLHLVGNLRKYKIGKGYEISRAKFNQQFSLYFYLMARKNLNQNVTDSKEKLVKFNEQIAIKNKAGLYLIYLNKYLNNNSVNNSILDFYNNQLKSNSNSDFIKVIEAKSGQNLNWFSNLIEDTGNIDYTFGSFNKEQNTVKVINKTETSAPFAITGFLNKKPVFEQWYTTSRKDTTITFPDKFDKIALNYQNNLPEVQNRNNFKSANKLFNRPVRFIFLRDIENPYYNQVFYVPEIGFNVYDGAIISMNFHNKSLIEKPFVFDLSPSYSSNTQNFTGSGAFAYTQQRINSNLFQIRYAIAGSYFHYIQDASYQRLTPTIAFRFRNNNDLRDNFRQSIAARLVNVNKEFSPLSTTVEPLKYSVFDLRYTIGDGETAKGYGIGANYQYASNFSKFIIEANYRKLFENNLQLNTRLYFGTFLNNKTNTNFYDFGLDRPKDYLFDYNYYGRSENSGLFSQQIIIAEGGFKSKFINPYANQWLVSSNVSTSVWKYVLLYADAGFYKNKYESPKFAYDTGVQFSLVPDYFELFFPLYSSNGFEPSQKNYQEKIRFIVTINPSTLFRLFTRKWF